MIQPVRAIWNQPAENQPAAMIPPAAAAAVVNVPAAEMPAAMLLPLPRTIHALWHEYEFGIGGRKPAGEFTPTERGGKNKHSYYCRRVVWDVVDTFVCKGWSANAVCDRIYETYGRNQSVTYIINRMLQDHKTGRHPNLRVNNL